MNHLGFLRIVDEALSRFLAELGFEKYNALISGRIYSVDFGNSMYQVSVSFEPVDSTIVVLVGEAKNGRFVDIDDKRKTLRLADLNACFLPQASDQELIDDREALNSIAVSDREERQLLKAARELRIVLPRYLQSRANA